MNLGVVARADDRGIGIQSWELCRAMRPAKVLVVDMGELARGFPMHLDRYPGATVAKWDGALPELQVRRWLDGLDVVFSVETLYDWRIAEWAEDAGVATVVQANPEFTRPIGEYDHAPTVWWNPTTWRQSHMPPGTQVVPVPVADDRFRFAPAPESDVLRVLHVAGHAAMADRNGTHLLGQALRYVRGRMQVRIVTQDDRLRLGRVRPTVDLEVVTGGVADYWRLYEDADVLVLPRRYGGLCLPVQEAMAAGLAVVMSDTEPQRSTWPVSLVRSATGVPKLRCPAGRIAQTNARPEAIAAELDALDRDRERLAEMKRRSVEWAQAHRWSVLRPVYEAEFAAAVAARKVRA